MKLAQLLKYTEALSWAGDGELDIGDVTNDSRLVKPNSLFVAIPGFKADGHQYIAAALERGAKAVVIQDERFCSPSYSWILVTESRKALAELSAVVSGLPSRQLNVIGVTGTNGKTTTTNLIASILEDAGHTTGLIGTIHNRIGEEIIPVHHTTPEAPEIQQLFARFLERGARYAVMEVSSHALDLYRVEGTEFDIAVFTNLTQDHLDFHRNMEQYLAAKGKLFAGLGKKNHKQRRKFAIINGDDPYSDALAEMTSAPVIRYGIRKKADVRAEQLEIKASGVKFTLKYTDRQYPVLLKLTGIFNVYNALAAIAVGLVEGITPESIVSSLEKIGGIPGRFEKVDAGQDFTVIVDYSHTPDSLENCLKTAREFVQRRIITVFGCGGDRDKTKRPLMGEVAGRLSDYCIVTSDNPRSEQPEEIIEQIVTGLEKRMDANSFAKITDRREAIFRAVGMAGPGDVVIIAGKGHEDYQIIGPQVLPFDDRLVAREALARMTGGS